MVLGISWYMYWLVNFVLLSTLAVIVIAIIGNLSWPVERKVFWASVVSASLWVLAFVVVLAGALR